MGTRKDSGLVSSMCASIESDASNRRSFDFTLFATHAPARTRGCHRLKPGATWLSSGASGNQRETPQHKAVASTRLFTQSSSPIAGAIAIREDQCHQRDSSQSLQARGVRAMSPCGCDRKFPRYRIERAATPPVRAGCAFIRLEQGVFR